MTQYNSSTSYAWYFGVLVRSAQDCTRLVCFMEQTPTPLLRSCRKSVAEQESEYDAMSMTSGGLVARGCTYGVPKPHLTCPNLLWKRCTDRFDKHRPSGG